MGYFLSSYLFVYTLTSIVKSRLLNASQFVLVKSKNLRTLSCFPLLKLSKKELNIKNIFFREGEPLT